MIAFVLQDENHPNEEIRNGIYKNKTISFLSTEIRNTLMLSSP